MSGANVDVVGAEFLECARGLGDGARSVDHVVGNEAITPFDIANDVHDFGDICFRTPLVDNGKCGVEPFRETARHLGRPHVRGNDAEIVESFAPEVIREDRCGVQVIDRNVEKPLQLMRVQIQAQNAICSSLFDHVGHQLGADRNARLVLAILSRVTEVRQHGRDTSR